MIHSISASQNTTHVKITLLCSKCACASGMDWSCNWRPDTWRINEGAFSQELSVWSCIVKILTGPTHNHQAAFCWSHARGIPSNGYQAFSEAYRWPNKREYKGAEAPLLHIIDMECMGIRLLLPCDNLKHHMLFVLIPSPFWRCYSNIMLSVHYPEPCIDSYRQKKSAPLVWRFSFRKQIRGAFWTCTWCSDSGRNAFMGSQSALE